MRPRLRDRIRWAIGERLANTPAWPLILRYDGSAPVGYRYTNRINGHVVGRLTRPRGA